MNSIGAMMQAARILDKGTDNPVAVLRQIVDEDRDKLNYLMQKYPEKDYSKQLERLKKLDLICQSLEQCEPVTLMKDIKRAIIAGQKNEADPDVVVILFPLKPEVKRISYCKPAFADFVWKNIDNAREYEKIGIYNRKEDGYGE